MRIIPTVLVVTLFFATIQIARSEEAKPATSQLSPNVIVLLQKVWYNGLYAKERPTTFKTALAAEHGLLDEHGANPYWKEVSGPGLKNVCAALHAVKVACDYNSRVTLTMFLAYYGKPLFPAAGGTNPYYTEADRQKDIAQGDVDPDNVFIGHPPQNDMLAASIRKNVSLFKNGDLSAEDVQKRWKK